MTRRSHGEGTVYQRADGKWIAEVQLPNDRLGRRRRRKRIAKTKKEAAEDNRRKKIPPPKYDVSISLVGVASSGQEVSRYLAALNASLGENHPDTLSTRQNLVETYLAVGQSKDASGAFEVLEDHRAGHGVTVIESAAAGFDVDVRWQAAVAGASRGVGIVKILQNR